MPLKALHFIHLTTSSRPKFSLYFLLRPFQRRQWEVIPPIDSKAGRQYIVCAQNLDKLKRKGLTFLGQKYPLRILQLTGKVSRNLEQKKSSIRKARLFILCTCLYFGATQFTQDTFEAQASQTWMVHHKLDGYGCSKGGVGKQGVQSTHIAL